MPLEAAQSQASAPEINDRQNTVKGAIALVTGANGGIGKAVVEGFLRAGVSKVYAAVRDVDRLTKKKIIFQGDETYCRVVPLYIDLADPSSIYQAAMVASDVQIIVNSAGILHRTDPNADDAVEKLRNEMEINVYGLMHLAKAFEDILDQNANSSSRYSFLVQLNSAASLRCSSPSVSTNSASKAASFSMTQAFRQSFDGRKKKIHVISVHPGPITSRMTAGLGALSDLAEPPSVVADAILDAMGGSNNGSSGHSSNACNSSTLPFLVFPDEMAKNLGEEYSPYAQKVIEEGKVYGDYERNIGLSLQHCND
jgi:NAD(P)-dependent dehydrogenase (short-subunit alcohol dehydrogenase family)